MCKGLMKIQVSIQCNSYVYTELKKLYATKAGKKADVPRTTKKRKKESFNIYEAIVKKE